MSLRLPLLYPSVFLSSTPPSSSAFQGIHTPRDPPRLITLTLRVLRAEPLPRSGQHSHPPHPKPSLPQCPLSSSTHWKTPVLGPSPWPAISATTFANPRQPNPVEVHSSSSAGWTEPKRSTSPSRAVRVSSRSSRNDHQDDPQACSFDWQSFSLLRCADALERRYTVFGHGQHEHQPSSYDRPLTRGPPNPRPTRSPPRTAPHRAVDGSSGPHRLPTTPLRRPGPPQPIRPRRRRPQHPPRTVRHGRIRQQKAQHPRPPDRQPVSGTDLSSGP